MTPAANWPTVSMTPVVNHLIIRTFVTAVNNTSGKFATSVNEIGSKFKLNMKQFF
jgi:hypothetical protein